MSIQKRILERFKKVNENEEDYIYKALDKENFEKILKIYFNNLSIQDADRILNSNYGCLHGMGTGVDIFIIKQPSRYISLTQSWVYSDLEKYNSIVFKDPTI